MEQSRHDEAVDEVVRELENHVRFCHYVPPTEIERRVGGRVKDLDKIHMKIDRGRRRPPIVKSLSEVEARVRDIAGVRVILDRLEHVDETGRFIKENAGWRVTKVERKRRDDTGYRALHMDVLLNTTHHCDVRCEIQLRTLLQHAYALWTTPMYEHYRASAESIPDFLLGQMCGISDHLHLVDGQVNRLNKRFREVMQ